jgi:hypothetical protein
VTPACCRQFTAAPTYARASVVLCPPTPSGTINEVGTSEPFYEKNKAVFVAGRPTAGDSGTLTKGRLILWGKDRTSLSRGAQVTFPFGGNAHTPGSHLRNPPHHPRWRCTDCVQQTTQNTSTDSSLKFLIWNNVRGELLTERNKVGLLHIQSSTNLLTAPPPFRRSQLGPRPTNPEGGGEGGHMSTLIQRAHASSSRNPFIRPGFHTSRVKKPWAEQPRHK